MSKDIRSFFTVLSKKNSSDASNSLPSTSSKNKRQSRIIDSSDDDDVIIVTPQKDSQKGNNKHVKVYSRKTNTLSEKNKLKHAAVNDIFKNTPIKQSEISKPQLKVKSEVSTTPAKKRKKNASEKSVHDDVGFQKTLEDLDDDFFTENLDELERTITEVQDLTTEDVKETEEENMINKKRSRTESPKKETPKRKKLEHVDSGVDPGQEAYEKRRYSAMLYEKYLTRSGPKHLGSKEIPKGNKDCLKNLCFIRTGVLDSMEGEDFENLIKDHGGRVVHSVSKKVNYIVVGEDPGPAKLAKAESLNIPKLSEDDVLDLIRKKSGLKTTNNKDNSGSSEDLGIEQDIEPNKKIMKIDKASFYPKVEKTPSKIKEKTLSKTTEKTPSKLKEKTPPKEVSNKQLAKPVKNHDANSSSFQRPVPAQSIDPSSLTLSEKYRPQNLKSIIGQQGDRSNVKKLKYWLENWDKNREIKQKKALVKPHPYAKSDDGAYFQCALLSGPPGVGKTTTAILVAKELGLDIVELNASDTRSKKLLHEEISQLLQTKTISAFATGKQTTNTKRVLLMDEVDGMAGNEDRGGIQELIQLIKITRIPIVCMCNDRNHQKMRSLVNYCFDLRFTKPKLDQIKGAMMSVCFKEKIDINGQALSEIIAGTDCDIRQTLNHLAILGCNNKKISPEIAAKESKLAQKDVVMGPWEVCRAVFTKSDQNGKSTADKARLFFFDYSLGPLFVQENYLRVQPEDASKKGTLLKLARTASSISTGDIIDSKIRRTNNWSILESQAFFSSVFPGHYMAGHFTGQINFPGWLGKNSKRNKFRRLHSEIQLHTRTSVSANMLAIKLDYVVPLRDAIITPLQKYGTQGVDQAVSVMKHYNLLREDLDSLVELSCLSGSKNPMKSIPTQVKSAFTRSYNKQVSLLPFAPMSNVAKKRAAAAENELADGDDALSEPDESDDDITKNEMIKRKDTKVKKTEQKPQTSKKKEPKNDKPIKKYKTK